jgi:hypothetical protein
MHKKKGAEAPFYSWTGWIQSLCNDTSHQIIDDHTAVVEVGVECQSA